MELIAQADCQTRIGDERELAPDAGIEGLAVRLRVELLPVEPELLFDPVAVEEPLEPGLVGTGEREGLPFERRQQLVWATAIPSRFALAGRVERPEDEMRPTAPEVQRQDRPDRAERVFVTERMVAEDAGPDGDLIIEVDVQEDASLGSQQGLTLAPRIEELRVVAVEGQVRSERDPFLGESVDGRQR